MDSSMTPERWAKISEVLERALQLSSEERAGFLERVCPSDPQLRREVESILSANVQTPSGFLQSPPVPAELTQGSRLGDYEIQSLLGAGGMGGVYRARDLHLRRDVALKVLPPFASIDPERLRRFEQEALAAAALNHPNVLAIYQFGEHQGSPYLVSELLEGETLRDRLNRGPLPLANAIDYGIQIARGLAAAHEKGIVHRDLKPENLFVTHDGLVKILDFGLAKLVASRHSSGNSALTRDDETEPGKVMGTVGYMAPEQVRGKPSDDRADIFAFGTILYEMLAGVRAFQKPTSAETMTAILNEEPVPIAQIASQTPPALQRVLHRSLQKDPLQRFQSASDMLFALQALSDSGVLRISATGTASSIPTTSAGARHRWAVLLAIALLALAAIAAWLVWPVPPPRVLSTTQITHDGVPKLQVFTDGSRLYLSERKVADQFLVQGSVAGGETSVLPTPFTDVFPTAVSPDHSQLLVYERIQTERELQAWLLPLPTGPPRRLPNVVGRWGTWSPDGQQLLFARGNALFVGHADGTDAHKLLDLPGAAFYVRFSPDGRRIRFTLVQNNAVSIWEVRSDGTDLHRVFPEWQGSLSEHAGVWTADGRYYLFLAKTGLLTEIWAMRESPGIFRARLPVKLATGPLSFGQMAPSPDGKKLYVDGFDHRAELVRYDAPSHQFVPYMSGISAGELDFSRDGKWVTYVSYPDESVWRSRVDGSDKLQLTYPPISALLPRWSPDGTQIAFVDDEPGKHWRIMLVPAAGGTPTDAYVENLNQLDPGWSLDGKRLLFGGVPIPGTTEKLEIQVLDLASHQASVIPGTEGFFSPRWSPDGQHMLALTESSKKLMLWDAETGKWSEWVSEPGAVAYPTWSSDGRYAYYSRVSTDQPSFRRVRLGENHSESLIDLKDLPRYSTSVGAWSGLAPDGSALFVRNLSTDEIYALDLDLP